MVPTGSTTITVNSVPLVSISVTPANSTLQLGISQSMTATGVYSDASTADLTTSVVWTTTNSTCGWMLSPAACSA